MHEELPHASLFVDSVPFATRQMHRAIAMSLKLDLSNGAQDLQAPTTMGCCVCQVFVTVTNYLRVST